MEKNDTEDVSIIHTAAMNNNDNISEIQKIIFKNEFSVDHADSKGRTPLMLAVICGNYNISKHLIRSGADKNKTDINGWSALHHAVKTHHTVIAKMLVNKGIYIPSEGEENCLHMAVEMGNIDLVLFLLQHGADSRACNASGCTPLMVACNKGYQKIALELIRKCPMSNSMINTVNKYGYSALHFAAEIKLAGVVDKLLKKGTDINLRNKDGITPLYLATEKGHTYIVGVLVSQNANPNISSEKSKDTPCHIAAKKGQFEIIYCLVTQGNANINMQNSDGDTPLHLAIIHQHKHIEQFLLTREPKMLKNHSGYTPKDLPNTHVASISEKQIHRFKTYSIRNKETCTLLRLDGSIRESKAKVQEIKHCFQRYDETIKVQKSQLTQRCNSYNEVEQIQSQQKKPLKYNLSFPSTCPDDTEETDAKEFESVDTYVKQQQIQLPRYQEELTSIEDEVTKLKSHSNRTDKETSSDLVYSTVKCRVDELDKRVNLLCNRLNDVHLTLATINDPGSCASSRHTSCNGSISDKFLHKAAEKLGKDWHKLGIELKIDFYELERIEMDHKGNSLSATMSMLVRWRDTKVAQEPYDKKLQILFESLVQMEREDIVRVLKDYLHKQ